MAMNELQKQHQHWAALLALCTLVDFTPLFSYYTCSKDRQRYEMRGLNIYFTQ